MVKLSSSCSFNAAATAAPEEIPGKNTFFFHQTTCGRNGFFIGDANDFVDQLEIKVSRDKTSANTLNFMRARFNLFTCQRLGDNWRIGWLNGDRDKIGLAFGAFNVAADASQRTASPNASNKYINLTVGIFQISGPVVFS